MKKLPWVPIAIAVLPLFGAGVFGFTDLKSDVRLVLRELDDDTVRSSNVRIGEA